MAKASDGGLTSEAARLRAAVQAEQHGDILSSLTTRTTVEAIEASQPHLRDPEGVQCHPTERDALVAEWRTFREAAAAGGEVWAFCSVGSCSSFEGFAVISGGRVMAESVTSVSTWI